MVASPLDPAAANDGLNSITQMLEGSQKLQDEPGVVYSLMQAQAHPADAQAIDQFMQGLDAEKQVQLARSQNQKIILSDQQQAMLSSTGVKYDDVLSTPQDAAKQAIDQVLKASGGKATAKTNPDGSLALDSKGNIQTVAVVQPAKPKSSNDGGGFLGVLGDALDGVTHALGIGVSDVANTLSKGTNFIESVATGDGFHNPFDTSETPVDRMLKEAAGNSEDMTAQGYNPKSIWSVLAFDASGRKHSDFSSIGLDQPKLDQVLGFLADPKGYRSSIENDPANWTTSPDGRPMMTAEGAAKLRYMQSDQFIQDAKVVNAHQATIGHAFANALGLDPTKDSIVPAAPGFNYNSVASTTDLAMSFAADPTLLALRGVQALKAAQIGVDWMRDADGAAKILTEGKGFFAQKVQRGWQTAIDLADQIRNAHAAGNEVAAAKATEEFSTKVPDLAPMMQEFIGEHAIVRYRDPTEAEAAQGLKFVPVFENTGGIRNMEDAAAYIRGEVGLQRLMNGRAVTDLSTMPGALSAVGLRRLHGATAGWLTERSAQGIKDAKQHLLGLAESNPDLAGRLIDEGILRKAMPTADDAVDTFSQKVIAYKPADSTKDALGNLMGALREGGPVQAEHAALSDELDSLENRMQDLMGDKTADPAELASVQDSIQTGRQLLAMVEQGLAPAAKDLKAAQAKFAQAEAVLPKVSVPGAYEAPASSIGLRVETTKTTLPSQARAQAQYEVTDKGVGHIQRSLRTRGDVLGDLGDRNAVQGLFSPTAIAARSAKAAQVLSGTLLPRNTVIDLADPRTGDIIQRYAQPWLGRGQASMLRAAYNSGDEGVRKSIVSGLEDQIAAAAGLYKTQTGKDLLARLRSEDEYSVAGVGPELNGQKLALLDGQTTQTWTLPSFQALQNASAKFGWWEATMGRALTSHPADVMMTQWKLGALFRLATITRNQLEGWLRTALDGSMGDAVKAKAVATMRNGELWDRGYGLDTLEQYKLNAKAVDQLDQQLATKGFTRDERTQMYADRRVAKRQMDSVSDMPIVQHHLATEAGDTELADKIRNSSMLSGQQLGRSALGQRLADFAPLALAGRAYRDLMFRHMNDAEVNAIVNLGPQKLAEFMEAYGQQAVGALGFTRAEKEATEIAKAGFEPSSVRVEVANAKDRGKNGVAPGDHTVWSHQATDGTEGALRYSQALGRLVNTSPETTKAVLDVLEQRGTLDGVVKAMEGEQKHTAFGSLFWDDPTSNAARKAVTPNEVELGKRDFAQKVVDEFGYMLVGRNNVYQKELAARIRETGQAPDADWIADHLTGDNRPQWALAPKVTAMPSGKKDLQSVVGALQDIEGAGYKWLVERPLQRTTSAPVFLAHYAKARVDLNPMVERLVSEGGLSREAAEAMAEDSATRTAMVKTETLIDDPGQKTQFDIIARNMFPFSRAVAAMARRWGEGLWKNPVAARKMMLAYEGAEHSGLIYDNAYGEPTFTYPASGVLNMAVRAIGQIPGFDGTQFPIAADMTGGVQMAVPGADNPFRMSMGPMLSMPLRFVYEHWLPLSMRVDAGKLDAAINGPVGAGEILPQLVPTAARTIYKNMIDSDRNSALASSMNGAFANLAAAGRIPRPDASPSEIQKFLTDLQTQVQNQLYLRAVFGLIAPASPSQPTEETKQSRADYAWSIDGVKSLSDEFKSILNEVHGNYGMASALFTTLHPDQVVYKTITGDSEETNLAGSAGSTAESRSSLKGAYLPPTESALRWMTNNGDFLKTYSSVAAYFLPNPTSSEPFNDAAYKMQLELALRQKKTPDEFLKDVYIKHAESVYYPEIHKMDAQIAELKAAGDLTGVQNLTQAKSDWEKQFKALNPMFADKIRQLPVARGVAEGQVRDLRQMLTKGDVPDGLGGKLQQLLDAWDGYNSYIQGVQGKDRQSLAMHTAALNVFNQWAQDNLTGTPLADVFNGVFRPLNPQLVKLDSPITEGP